MVGTGAVLFFPYGTMAGRVLKGHADASIFSRNAQQHPGQPSHVHSFSIRQPMERPDTA